MEQPINKEDKNIAKSFTTITKLTLENTTLKRNNRILKSGYNTLVKAVGFKNDLISLPHERHSAFEINKDNRTKGEATALALYGDAHCEEIVEAESINNFNAYNPDIFIKRNDNFFKNLLKIINNERRAINIPNLVLDVKGDNISGYIHEELLETNAMSPLQAAAFFKDNFIEGLKFLSEYGKFKQIKVVFNVGNHGRTSKRKKFKTGYVNNYEWLMYKSIVEIFEKYLTGYSNISFVMPNGFAVIYNIYDKRIRSCHGDHFNYRGGVGGVEIPLMTWLYKQNSNLDCDLTTMGHWHRNMDGGHAKYLINGAIKGYDEFAYELGFKYQVPMQQLQLIDSNPNRGLTNNYKIFLD